ncbi:MAG: hypothetical protein JST81_11105 [Bacteroidetes bacterium]|nr:hypothetical protein [Bacteroidota bacterium]
MKISILTIALLTGTLSYAQPKLIEQAVISTTTNVIAPEDEEQSNDGRMNFRNMMDGETKSTTYVKNDLVKTMLRSEVGKSTIIRNNTSKITTTLIEMMGMKRGFFVSDSEQVAMRDSMMKQRRKDTSASTVERKEPQTEISYSDETKKIAGYQCKKAFIISTSIFGSRDSITVWYTPEIKFRYFTSTGGLSAIGNMGAVNGLDKIDGFVLRYEMNMRRNRRMEVEVTKIDTGIEIADKEFDIPKDFDVQPMKDMQKMFGGMGGPPPMMRGNQ